MEKLPPSHHCNYSLTPTSTSNWVNLSWCQHQKVLGFLLSLYLLAGAAVPRKEDVHLDEDLQDNEHAVDGEEGHAHLLGQTIATAAEDDEQGHRRDDQDEDVVLNALGAHLLGLAAAIVDAVLDEPRHAQRQQDGQGVGS